MKGCESLKDGQPISAIFTSETMAEKEAKPPYGQPTREELAKYEESLRLADRVKYFEELALYRQGRSEK